MALRLHHFPFFKMTISLVSGILMAHTGIVPSVHVPAAIVIVALLFIITNYVGAFTIPYSFRWLHGIMGFATLSGLGCMLMLQQENEQEATQLPKIDDGLVQVEINTYASPGENTYTIEAQLLGALVDSHYMPIHDKAMLYVDSHQQALVNSIPGSRWLVPLDLFERIMPPTNPTPFNYAAFMAKRGFHFQAYLPAKTVVQLVDSSQAWNLPYLAKHFRQRLLESLQGLESTERSVAQALLLGYRADLEDSLRQQYANSGALHILAVSGLHVGIIFLFLQVLLWPLTKIPYGKFIKVLLLLASLWSYALITGMPPSVQRAAFMFSIISVAQNLNRPNSVYNNVLLSAFVLLCHQPNLLFDVGFQLSYAAVLGIISWQPAIAKWWKPQYRVLRYFWQILAVSLAAQLAVLPISLFYFNQFPLVFPLTNLVAIPAAFAIVFGGIFVVSFDFFWEAGHAFLLFLYQHLLQFTNDYISFLGSLPFSHIDGLYISSWDVWLLYVAIIACSFHFMVYNTKALKLGLSLLIIATAISLWQDGAKNRQQQFAVLDTGKQVTLALSHTSSAHFLTTATQPDEIAYTTAGYLQFHELAPNANTIFHLDSFARDSNMALPNINWPLLQLDSSLVCFHYKKWQPIEADIHVVCNYGVLRDIPEDVSGQLVLASPIYQSEKLMKKPIFANAWWVRHEGAFYLEN